MFKKQSDYFLVLDIDACSITGALFVCDRELRLVSYHTVLTTELPVLDGILMNASRMYDFMQHCIQEERPKKVWVHVLFSPSVMAVDTYVHALSSAADVQTFKKHVPSFVDWDFVYVGALDNGAHLFYIHGMMPAVMCAWRITLSKNPFYVRIMIPKSIASFETYKQIYGQSFRRSGLAIDLKRVQYNSDALFGDMQDVQFLTQYIDRAVSICCSLSTNDVLKVAGMLPTMLVQ